MLNLILLPYTLAICQLNIYEQLPLWALENSPFMSITKTENEISLVTTEDLIPENSKAERNWHALMIEGPLDFSLTGILASLANPLAQAKISIFAISTFNTDYILVKNENLEAALDILSTFCIIKAS